MLPILIESAVLGAAAFACGILPLSFSLSKQHQSILTTIGTGLLLGTALGVIIPEGVETLLSAGLDADQVSKRVALSLLIGFMAMLAIEQLVSRHSHSHNALSVVDFDAELHQLEDGTESDRGLFTQQGLALVKEKALSTTLGLVIHSLVDGFALGVSFFPADAATSNLSAIVFLAIIVHKAPTSFALSTSLLSMSLPRPDCKKHVAVFAAATPLAAIASYATLSLGGSQLSSVTGVALLLSGGTFLYVATVLQPVSGDEAQDMKPMTRVALIVAGMAVPFTMASLLGHGH
ncbi:Zinc/iron permease [Cylindrobasidium torrendii FP15055 ss-10]|uniref:Zinc/iron permease n=1 Tax=Cylindrobasidium torrendii FP15055 ss-10 TaxID=1314674 RepID=A0A0D7BPL1_9AGAR|nr:Zinc/iron permease [Cylindrobasidium torrendii FP15055 ss-10]